MHLLQSIFPAFQNLQTIVNADALTLRNRPLPVTRLLDDIVSMHTPIIIRPTKRKIDKNGPAVQHSRRRLF
ncbi:hypothetical protein HPULCUR_007772 [Helicostylum pulchrum]|uniref:Uncharacterized protein n=1 Tax=Helicostylum pulchrum TaxID=562976 RepID=A0ABP9Y635_9FUNG